MESDEAADFADERDYDTSPAYWAAYVMQAYDSKVARDFDPNTEAADVGYTLHLNPALSFVFLETMRDFLANGQPTWNPTKYNQQTVAHEVGHHFVNDPNDGHLMDETAAPSGAGLTFSENDLAGIRNKVQPQ